MYTNTTTCIYHTHMHIPHTYICIHIHTPHKYIYAQRPHCTSYTCTHRPTTHTLKRDSSLRVVEALVSTKLPPKFPVPQYIFLCLGFPASPAHPKGLYKSLRQPTSLERGDSNKLRPVLNLPAMESGSGPGADRNRESKPTHRHHQPPPYGHRTIVCSFQLSKGPEGPRPPSWLLTSPRVPRTKGRLAFE